MAYATNDLNLVTKGPLTGSGQQWRYTSADAKATVAAAGYFSDALKKGMLVNDQVFVNDTATPLLTSHRVTVVASTGATLSVGVTVS